MYTTGWTTRSLITSNDKQVQIRHFPFCCFFPSLYSYTVTSIIHILITMRVIVIATVRDDFWDKVVLSR